MAMDYRTYGREKVVSRRACLAMWYYMPEQGIRICEIKEGSDLIKTSGLFEKRSLKL